MYGYIYLTTNLINGRKYIGQKKSSYFKGIDYLGSGKILRQAIEKYGYENFSVVLLEECSSKEELDEREKHHIRINNAVDSDEFYNIAFGGQSRVHRLSQEEKDKISYRNSHPSDETRRKLSESQKLRCAKFGNQFQGKNHTDESKRKQSVVHSRENLSQETRTKMSKSTSAQNTGRVWINDGRRNKFIKFGELEDFIGQGYSVGRLVKFQEGTIWITDGISNKRISADDIIPNGWWRGSTQRRKVG